MGLDGDMEGPSLHLVHDDPRGCAMHSDHGRLPTREARVRWVASREARRRRRRPRTRSQDPDEARMAGVTTAGLYFRAFFALGNGGGFAHQACGLDTKRGGDLNVDELVGILDPGLETRTSILAPFSGSMAGWSTRT